MNSASQTDAMPETATDHAPLLKLQGIAKRFGPVVALDKIDFELRAGEIHALLGENGAGKSTLIKVLGGIHRADAGQIRVDGRPVPVRSVADADRLGICIIHQELSLAPNLTVAENIYLGHEPSRCGWLRRGTMDRNAGTLVRTLGLGELRDVRAPVATLSTAHQQLVEIARALSRRARILVLDEPTSSLSEVEAEALFTTLRRLRDQGVGIIYISHRLAEIECLADRITVLRDGRSIGTKNAADVDEPTLIEWMVGRNIQNRFARPAYRPGAVALRARGLRSATIHGVSFTLRYGEVLGLAGLVGAGRTELVRAIYGIDRLDGGEILVDEKPVAGRAPRDALAAGIVLVPEDRQRDGLVLGQSVAFNIALPWLKEWLHGCWPNRKKQRAIVDRTLERFGVRLADSGQRADSLSGGNQQKVLVGRWMEHPPKVLILDEPTRGIDVGAREEMVGMIDSLVQRGMAVLLISSDLDEVLRLSHRVGLYRDGHLLDVVEARSITAEQVMHQLTGATNDENC